MNGFLINIAKFLGIYILYKIILFSSVLLLNKQPLHHDLGKNGKNQYIITGSSNTHFSYNYSLLNTDSNIAVRSCWVPASYGVVLNLYKLHAITQPKSNIIFEYPYHWYLIDQMAPHNYSFYSHATSDVFSFMMKKFPLDLLMHFSQYTVLNKELFEYYIKQASFKPYHENFNQLDTKGDFSEKYYTCDTSDYKKESHYVLCSQFQEFQFNKIHTFLQEIVKEKNGEFHFSFPPIEKNNYTINQQLISRLNTNVIKPFQDCIWERKYLFDARYHLNKCGTDINSRNFLELIQSKH